jgi:dCMP deaminase
MNKIDPHKSKYFNYYMELAVCTAKQSTALKRKVGAVIVLPTGLLAVGWNGMPPSFNNNCEVVTVVGNTDFIGDTKPEVIHAERNALDKLTRQGVSTEGAILFTTTAPCIQCAKSIANVGITDVFYLDKYKCDSGIKHLKKSEINITQFTQ